MSEKEIIPSSEPVYGIIFQLVHADVQEPVRLGPNTWLLYCHKVEHDQQAPEHPSTYYTGVEVTIPVGHEGIISPHVEHYFRLLPYNPLVNIQPGTSYPISISYSPAMDETDIPGEGFPVCKLEVRKVPFVDVISVTRKDVAINNYSIIKKSLGDLDKNQN